jgi:dipeptidyl-peptidase-4
MKRRTRLFFVALVISFPLASGAQEKQRYASMVEALQSSAILFGRQGPQDVNWIEGGRRFSYTDRDQRTGTPAMRAYDPLSGRDTVLFTSAGLTFPGTNQPFGYDSFQWAHDSKHLVF